MRASRHDTLMRASKQAVAPTGVDFMAIFGLDQNLGLGFFYSSPRNLGKGGGVVSIG
jgi:hypothetical protein